MLSWARAPDPPNLVGSLWNFTLGPCRIPSKICMRPLKIYMVSAPALHKNLSQEPHPWNLCNKVYSFLGKNDQLYFSAKICTILIKISFGRTAEDLTDWILIYSGNGLATVTILEISMTKTLMPQVVTRPLWIKSLWLGDTISFGHNPQVSR